MNMNERSSTLRAAPLEFPESARLVLDAVGSSPPMEELLAALTAETNPSVSGLVGAGRAAGVAACARRSGHLVVWVVPEGDAFETASADLATWLEDRLLLFPPRDTRPYQWSVPAHELVAARLFTLTTLLDGAEEGSVLLTTPRAWLEATLTPADLRRRRLALEVGSLQPRDELIAALAADGYLRSDVVEEVGQYAVRGGLIDLFPTSQDRPLRVELFGDEIASIRLFDVATQRTVKTLDQVDIWPQREAAAESVELDLWIDSLAPEAQTELELHRDPASEPPGLEWLFSPLGARASGLSAYLPAGTLLWLSEPEVLTGEDQALRNDLATVAARLQKSIPEIPGPDLVLADARPILEQWSAYRSIEERELGRGRGINFGMKPHPSIHGNLPVVRMLADEVPIPLLWGPSHGQLAHLYTLLDEPEPLVLCRGALVEGFRFDAGGLLCFTEHEIFARRPRPKVARRFREGVALSSYTSLSVGDFVVHVDYGVGRYRGLRTLKVGDADRDFLELRYVDDDKVFVPIESFNRVRKFTGKEGAPQLSKLGTGAWEKIKARTKRKILEMAADLVQLYAARKARPGFAFGPDDAWMTQLEETFPYEETPDQAEALAALKRDMETASPMDRLISGDVGFGKTELAIRAAMKAIASNKQVAVLVPTTILAQQHLETFTERLAPFPVRVEMLSRFRSAAEQAAVAADVGRGKVDVIIGTHRLLSKDVQFRDLGLLVVDEEQRFGVTHKEKIKKLKTEVDCLTLSATPIPRTLQMALFGARDLSVINTPPKGRLPVHTEIAPFSDEVIRGAVLREIDRGGQVFFVHNRVGSIAAVYRYLKGLFGGLDIVIAHGQMKETELERVMLEFSHKKHQILLSTSIIESGLDIPLVNTIIINRAHTFGLAQLYQLRGRVGRSARQAFSYLLVPPAGALSRTARRRLAAIEQHSDLGSGFHLAMRDLEIRGAGNLLGAQQHGFIEAVGFDLYNRMIEEAVAELRGTAPADTRPVQLDTDIPLRLTEEYIAQATLRVDLYQRLADATTPEAVAELEQEVADRFGPLPQAAANLFAAAACRLVWGHLGVVRVTVQGDVARWEWSADRTPDRKLLERLASRIAEPHRYTLGKTLVMNIDWGRDRALARFRNVLQEFWPRS